jgi:V/A-type H+-transporting ATPase subunit E
MEQGKAHRLRERIIKDAEEEAGRIVAEGRAEAESVKADANAEVEETARRAQARAADEAKEYVRRQISIRELEARKAVLAEKGRFMDEAFSKAIEELRRKDVEGGYSLTKTLLLRLIATGDEEIVVSPEDKENLGGAFLSDLNRQLKEKGLKGEVKIAADTQHMKGGFILRSGRKETNVTFESMLDSIRDDAEIEIAGVLFREAR